MAEPRTQASVNGVPTVLLQIRKQSGTNTVEVAANVKRRLAELEAILPPGYQLRIVRDEAQFIDASIAAVEEHLIVGSILAAIVVFTLASVGCALSASLPMLVAMRIVQGIGGAMMVPVGRLAVLRNSAKSDLVRAIALLTWPALAAPVLAPVLGGAIATVGSWRWIFIVNILILVYRIVAAIDAWNVARFLNEVDASGGGRLGRSKLPLSPLSVAGLLAVLIVLGGAHIAVARYERSIQGAFRERLVVRAS